MPNPPADLSPEELLTLTLDDARTMPEELFRETFCAIAMDLHELWSNDDQFREDRARIDNPFALSTAEMIEYLGSHQKWFAPKELRPELY